MLHIPSPLLLLARSLAHPLDYTKIVLSYAFDAEELASLRSSRVVYETPALSYYTYHFDTFLLFVSRALQVVLLFRVPPCTASFVQPLLYY